MTKIEFDQILPGMILAKPVKNFMGAILLNAGVTLQDQHIKILKIWRIEDVFIENDQAATEISAEAALLLSEHRKEIEHMFAGITSPIMLKIKDIAFEILEEEIP